MATNDLTIPALDGRPLAATLLEPDRPRQIVIVGSATAVPRGFYRGIAAYLAQRGAAVLTYDYRGSGEAPEVLRASTASMRDWGQLDFPGAIAWAKQRYPHLPLHVLGHSHGGHALLLAPNNAEIDRAFTVATQLGYWRLCAPGERYRVWLLLNAFAPVAMALMGYVPGSRLGLGEDLARGVMREWRQWCNSPNYFYDDPTMQAALESGKTLRAPTLVAGIADDLWGTVAAVDAYAAHVPNAQRVTIEPGAYGLGNVGHFGFFRAANGPALWPLVTRYFGLEEIAA